MEPLWTFDAFASAAGGHVLKASAPAQGLSIDTRTLKSGDAFVALRGANFDGHDFVAKAFEKGAAFALVRADQADVLPAGPCIGVENVERAVESLARVRRQDVSAKIVAITGSVGKTGTKEALRLALGSSGVTHASAASFNNHWGVPLSVARMPRNTQFGVFEIGMSHAGEITPLARLVRPHITVITTVAAVHLEHFANVEGIAEAKAEIFQGLEPGGVAILPFDNAYFPLLHRRAQEAGAHILTFGEKEGADVRLLEASLQPSSSHIAASVSGVEATYRLNAPGKHAAVNSLAVLAAVQALGADLALAALALAQLTPTKGRGARKRCAINAEARFTLIDESYNANPTSMRAALEVLGATAPGAGGRRIAVLGDMLELGADAAALHDGLIPALDANRVDLVFAVGPLMQQMWNRLPASRRGARADLAAGIEAKLIESIQPGDVVMVKGSLGSKMGPVVESLLLRFPATAEG